ncbi:MAG TPA: hypothetical protein PKN29_00750 [Candidatus Ozemobacteraceae bacterium]|nr:hypothetical protein [Candidatus Ozemobacteraceae bacterium]
MKNLTGLFLLLQLLLSASCGQNQAEKEAFKTLKFTRFDQQNMQAWYVPTRAVLSGPGNATAPVLLLIGKEMLLQGMLKLQESSEDRAALENELRARYGANISLKRDLTSNVLIKAELNGKTVFEHQTMSGNQGLPLMINLPDPGSASLKIHLQFSPVSTQDTAFQKTRSFNYSRTVQTVNGQKQAEERAIATATTIAQPVTGSFDVTHDIELR